MCTTKKILYTAVSVLLVVCIVALFFYDASGQASSVQSFSGDEIAENAQTVGYTVEVDPHTGETVYYSLLDLSYILLPHDGTPYNTVIVTLSDISALSEQRDSSYGFSPKLYYNTDACGGFVEDNYCTARISDDMKTIVFRSYHTGQKNCIALNITEDFSIESVSVYNVDASNVTLKLNITALSVLLFMLVVLLIAEKKLGYFSWIVRLTKQEIQLVRTLKGGNLALHAISLISSLLLIALITVCIVFKQFWVWTVIVTFMLSVIAVSTQIADRVSSGRGSSVAALFLIVTVLVGLMMCYTSPISTHSAWDDEIHLRFAYFAGRPFDYATSLAEFKLFTHSYSISDYASAPLEFTKIMSAESQIPVSYAFEAVNPYTAISYSPMIMMCALLGLLQSDLVTVLVLCRLANLFAWALICYAGIKKLRDGQLIFSAVCLLPALLYLGCSFSYDFWLTACFTYAFASVIAALQRPNGKICASDIAKILLAFFVGCSAKALYCVMILPLLFINKDRFTRLSIAKAARILTVLVIVLILAALILPGVLLYGMYADPRGGTDVDPAGQIAFILSEPWRFIKILFNHLGEYCSLSRFNTYSTAYGFLGGYDGSPYPFFGTLACLILVFCVVSDNREKESYDLLKSQRWLMLGGIAVQIAVISISMYIAFTNVGSATVNGCQFRYVFPLLAPFFYYIRPRGILYQRSDKLKLAIAFGSLGFNLLSGYFVTYILAF